MAEDGSFVTAAVVAALLTVVPASGSASVPTSDPANCERTARETVTTAHTSPALDGFRRVEATLTAVDGVAYELCVLVADTPERQGRGLMDVTDVDGLDGADGMVFVWDEPVAARFYMWNTPMPLTLAFFDADGTWIGGADMDPCLDDTAAACERYSAPSPYCVALELPQGEFADDALGPGASLTLDDLGEARTVSPRGCFPR